MKKFIIILLSLTMVLSLAACGAKDGGEVDTSNYPTKPVEVIVAFKAGGGTDIGARILASVAEKNFDKPIVIKNRDGSDGELGYTELANAKPDGYTIGFINLPTFVSLTLERDTKYKVDDVVPILNHVYDPGALIVQSSSQWETLDDFVAYAKENPGDITIANNGTGASDHIGISHFAHEADIDVTHVPFGGSGGESLASLRGGHVDATAAKISEVASLIESGELRLLATFTEERVESFSDIPTMKEKGYNVLYGSARGLVAPKGTPQEIIDTLHDLFKAAIESDEHAEKAASAELNIQYMSPEDLGNYIKNEEKALKEILEILDLK